MDSLLPDTPFDSDQFLKALDEALAGVGQRRQAGRLSGLRFAFDKSWKRAYKKGHSYVDEQVKAALEATSSSSPGNQKSDQEAQPSPRRYVLLQDMAKQIRDPVELQYQIIGVFLPARDTTSILVSNAVPFSTQSTHMDRTPRDCAPG